MTLFRQFHLQDHSIFLAGFAHRIPGKQHVENKLFENPEPLFVMPHFCLEHRPLDSWYYEKGIVCGPAVAEVERIDQTSFDKIYHIA